MILIIDDDTAVRSSLNFMLKRAGYEAKAVPGPREAMDVVRAEAPELILMDMNFTLSTTGEEGLTLLRQVKIFRPDVPVILMTAWGSIQLAVQGMRAGAFDFITKPWNNASLLQRIETALQLKASSSKAAEGTDFVLERSHIIGQSKGLMGVLDTVARIARTNASVLVTGESGTGKELIAEAIQTWAASRRASSRARCSDTRKAPSPTPWPTARDASSWRTRAPSSSTKSATWICPAK